MAAQSLLCVSCGLAPPPHRRKWGSCKLCAKRNLPATYYCGEACMEAHWPVHRQWHKKAEEQTKRQLTGDIPQMDRLAAESWARSAERTGSDWDKRCAAIALLVSEGDNHGATKACREFVKMRPDEPLPYFHLATALARSSLDAEAANMFLKGADVCLDRGAYRGWAAGTANAFELLKRDDCREVPKPEWWNDEDLKALSARVVAVEQDDPNPCTMRAHVLSGSAVYGDLWNVGPRTATEIKEAATWYRRAAMVTCTPAHKLANEEGASLCDVVADPLLAEEEAEAARARAEAEAKEAEALKVAEAKAHAVAEKLLADEEEEKQQAASTKAGNTKQGKGKRGKGKR